MSQPICFSSAHAIGTERAKYVPGAPLLEANALLKRAGVGGRASFPASKARAATDSSRSACQWQPETARSWQLKTRFSDHARSGLSEALRFSANAPDAIPLHTDRHP